MGDNVYQFNLFNFNKEKFFIKNPIRLIELFAGIGAQAKALEVLGVPFEHYKICEWAAPSIEAYNSIHIKDNTDYSKNKTKEELVEFLNGNISTNYSDPCDCTKKPIEWLQRVYNNCVATHNLMNIMKVKGSDLNITETDKYTYIMTYSFPCQDLSLAGTRKGMETSQAQGGTRSGLLWEVERILNELSNTHTHTQLSTLPQVLLMENVPEVCGKNNVSHFNKWLLKLESLGYSNYFQIINAKDFGIPQNRRRCFMVSILGDYAYDFPFKIKLKYRLKDFLEQNVEEKYFLSEEDIERVSKWNCIEKPLEKIVDAEKENKISCITTHVGKDSGSMKLIKQSHATTNNVKSNGGGQIMIKENNNQGYKSAQVGDGVNLASRMKHQRGNVQHGSIQTLKTQMEVGVVVDEEK